MSFTNTAIHLINYNLKLCYVKFITVHKCFQLIKNFKIATERFMGEMLTAITNQLISMYVSTTNQLAAQTSRFDERRWLSL